MFSYIRVSTDRQDLSIEAQQNQIRRAAAHYCPEADPDTLQIFAEPDTSGSIPFKERPQGQALLRAIRQALADPSDASYASSPLTVFVPKLDRLGRNTMDVLDTVRTINAMGGPEHRTRVIFLDLNVDTRTPMGEFMVTVLAACAQLELERIRERIHNALDAKRARGVLTGGTVPFGWDAEPTGNLNKSGTPELRLVDNVEEQRWIIRMRQMADQGWGHDKIAGFLNANGVKTKRAGQPCKRRDPKNPDGPTIEFIPSGLWRGEQVRTVLESRTVQDWLNAA